jgi:hypothetical protein
MEERRSLGLYLTADDDSGRLLNLRRWQSGQPQSAARWGTDGGTSPPA